MINRQKYWDNLCLIFGSSILFYISLSLFLSQATSTGENYFSDLIAHIEIAESITNGNIKIAHNLLHFALIFISKITLTELRISMPILLSLFIVMQFLILYKYFQFELPEELNKHLFYALLAAVVMFSAPLHIPYLHGSRMFVGKVSNNIWHNPTIIGLKPIALLTFFTFLKFLKDPSIKKYQILFNVFLLLSIWMKPNFAIYFMPASFILLMISSDLNWNDKIISAIKLYSLATIGLLIMLYFQSKLSNGTSPIIFVFGSVWSYHATNIPVNILCSFLFPFAVILSNIESLKRKDLQLSLLGLAISSLQFYFLAESGDRMYHGNWGWGLQTSSIFVWMITLTIYIKEFKSYKILVNLFLFAFLMSHIYFGIIYSLHIFTGGGFW